jgi:hypothetical protein
MTSKALGIALAALLMLGLLAGPADAVLVARYNFDDSTATDQSTNSNDGSLGSEIFFTSDTPFASGQAGGGTRNANSVITVPTSTSLESIDDELTLSFWMKADIGDQQNWGRIFRHATGGSGDDGWIVNRNSGNNDVLIRIDTAAGGGTFNQNRATGGPAVYDGTWRHVLYTLNNGAFAEYVDGLLANSGTYDHGTGFSNTRSFIMFGRDNDGEYDGLLDDVALWSDAKGQAWPATIAGLAGFYGYSLDTPGLTDVALLSILGDKAVAGSTEWTYTDTFPAADDASPLEAGKHYVGIDGLRYIIFDEVDEGSFVGVRFTPEPGTLTLLGVGLAALARRRRKR